MGGGLSAKLFAKYAAVGDARALASVIGEEDLSEKDLALLEFGKKFEHGFVNQTYARTMQETITLAQNLL